MRIIAGIYKGNRINSVEGYTARPTSDFVREMVFSTLYSINPSFDKVLDLYAGSGAVGLEALSRGAGEVTFVDAAKKSISTIISNINLLKCENKCKVVLKKVDTFLRNEAILLSNEIQIPKYTLIFADPPYNKNLVNLTVKSIFENNFLAEDGILIIEHSKDEPIKDEFQKYIFKEKKTATIIISFLK